MKRVQVDTMDGTYQMRRNNAERCLLNDYRLHESSQSRLTDMPTFAH